MLSLGRYSVNVGFIERPFIAGAIWGAVTGDFATTLSLALFYELFWLDLFPAGTYMPPNQLFPMMCVFSAMAPLTAHTEATLFLPVVLTLPLAFVGALLEKQQREWQVSSYNLMILSLRAGENMGKIATKSVIISLAQLFAINFAGFFLVAFLVTLLFDQLAANGFSLAFPHASWPLLWTIGCVGGLLGLRIRRNYMLFAAGCAGVALLLAAQSWL